VSARATDRWRLTLPLALPALGGLAYLVGFGAPARLITGNAGALALALLWAALGRLPTRPKASVGLAAICALLLFVPVLIGPEVGGVSRWLRAGPVLMHSGTLLLPLIAITAAKRPRIGPLLLALAGAALALQPDAAALAGLAAVAATLAGAHRSPGFGVVAAAAAGFAALTFRRGTLEPQVFTEGVLAQVWQSAPLLALVLAALLFLAAPLMLLSNRQIPDAEGLALAAVLVTPGVMACLAPFPFPLIGYGASPILGFALALSAAGTARRG
jgi:hypothetical protein